MDPVTAGMAAQFLKAAAKWKMTRHLILCAIVGLLITPLALTVGAASQARQIAAGQQQTQPGNGAPLTCPDSVISTDFDADQTKNAATIYAVAQHLKMGDRAALVALVTALQESTLNNRKDGDLDSVGLFQQRADWGSFLVRMNPAKSARMFFLGGHGGQDGLKDVKGWQRMPVGVAAQAVQVSAFPDEYAKWEPAAQKLVAELGGSVPLGGVCEVTDDQGGGPVPASFDKQGNPRTVEQAIKYITSFIPGGPPGERIVGRCERLSGNIAYGLSGGYDSAIVHWNAPGPRTVTHSGKGIPRGALVFYNSPNVHGHVALSLGNGMGYSTDFNGTSYQAGVTGIGTLDQIGAAMGGTGMLGYRAPNFKVGSGN